MAKRDHDQIFIGDTILLSSPEFRNAVDAYVQADGVLNNDCHLACPPVDYHDCAFRISVQQQYSAALDLGEFKQTHQGTHKYMDQVDLAYYRMDEIVLNKACENEQHLNKEYMSTSIGNPVLFGQTIQLIHEKTGMHLSINEHLKATMQKDNVRVELSEGSPNSWFTLIPRYNRDQKGDPIYSHDNVLLQSQDQNRKNNKLFLHCANLVQGKERPTIWNKTQHNVEVNCSMVSSGWQLCRYRQFTATQKMLLQVGDCVRLAHLESKTHLVLLKSREDSCSDERGSAEILLQQKEDDQELDSNQVWVVTYASPGRGALVEWDISDSYRLRHLNTGLYLRVAEKSSGAMQICACEDPNVEGVSFSLSSAKRKEERSRAHIELRSCLAYLQFHHSNKAFFIQTGEEVDLEGVGIDRCAYNVVCAAADDLTDKGENSTFIHKTTMKVEPVTAAEVGYITKNLSCKAALQSCDIRQKLMMSTSAAFKHFKRFCAPSNPSQAAHQQVMREQGIIDSLLVILRRLYESNTNFDDKARRGSINDSCYQLLEVVMQGNHQNQLVIGKFLSVIIGQVLADPAAAAFLGRLLSSNSQLLQQHIGEMEVQEFITHLSSKHSNTAGKTALELLSALCSCNGRAILSNQLTIYGLLVRSDGDLSDVPRRLITMRNSQTWRGTTNWDSDGDSSSSIEVRFPTHFRVSTKQGRERGTTWVDLRELKAETNELNATHSDKKIRSGVSAFILQSKTGSALLGRPQSIHGARFGTSENRLTRSNTGLRKIDSSPFMKFRNVARDTVMAVQSHRDSGEIGGKNSSAGRKQRGNQMKSSPQTTKDWLIALDPAFGQYEKMLSDIGGDSVENLKLLTKQDIDDLQEKNPDLKKLHARRIWQTLEKEKPISEQPRSPPTSGRRLSNAASSILGRHNSASRNSASNSASGRRGSNVLRSLRRLSGGALGGQVAPLTKKASPPVGASGNNFAQAASIISGGKVPMDVLSGGGSTVDAMYFLVAQLNLFAELCLDRNYVVITFVRRCFNFGSALGVITNQSIHPKLRGAVVNVVMRVWVDANPQTLITLPLLSRLVQDRDGQSAESERTVSRASAYKRPPTRVNELDPLREMVLAHFRGLGPNTIDDENFIMTLRVTELAAMMLKFGMFPEWQLESLAKPILAALKRNVDWCHGKSNSRANTTAITSPPEKLRRVASERKLRSSPFKEKQSLRHWIINILDSKKATIAILFVVFLGVLVSVVQTVKEYEKSNILVTINQVCAAAFAMEVALRMYGMGIFRYLSDLSCVADLLVTIIDIVVIVITQLELSTAAASQTNFTRALRIIRLTRLVRIIKAARSLQRLQVLYNIVAEHTTVAKWELPDTHRCTDSRSKARMACLAKMVTLLADISRFTREARLTKLVQLFDEELHVMGNSFNDIPSLKKPSDGWKNVFASRRSSITEDGGVTKIRTLTSSTYSSTLARQQLLWQTKAAGTIDKVFEDSSIGDAHSMGNSNQEANVDLELLDLVLYDNVEVVESALSLIMSYHSRRRSFLEDAKQVQLLAGSSSKLIFRKIQMNLKILQELTETFEEYRNTPDCSMKLQAILEILDFLCRCCLVHLEKFKPQDPQIDDRSLVISPFRTSTEFASFGAFFSCLKSSMEDGDQMGRVNREIQIVLRHLQADNVLMSTMRTFILFTVDESVQILSRCADILVAFSVHNPENQERLHSISPFFEANLGNLEGASRILTATYASNHGLCNKSEPKLIRSCFDTIIHFLPTSSKTKTASGNKQPTPGSLSRRHSAYSIEDMEVNKKPNLAPLHQPIRRSKEASQEHRTFIHNIVVLLASLMQCRGIRVSSPTIAIRKNQVLVMHELDRHFSVGLQAQSSTHNKITMTKNIQNLFMRMLTGCAIGTENRMLEAKLQNLFPSTSILPEIVNMHTQLSLFRADTPQRMTLLRNRTRMLIFFYHAFIRAESKERSLEQNPDMWKLLASFNRVFKATGKHYKTGSLYLVTQAACLPISTSNEHLSGNLVTEYAMSACMPTLMTFLQNYAVPSDAACLNILADLSESILEMKQSATILNHTHSKQIGTCLAILASINKPALSPTTAHNSPSRARYHTALSHLSASNVNKIATSQPATTIENPENKKVKNSRTSLVGGIKHGLRRRRQQTSASAVTEIGEEDGGCENKNIPVKGTNVGDAPSQDPDSTSQRSWRSSGVKRRSLVPSPVTVGLKKTSKIALTVDDRKSSASEILPTTTAAPMETASLEVIHKRRRMKRLLRSFLQYADVTRAVLGTRSIVLKSANIYYANFVKILVQDSAIRTSIENDQGAIVKKIADLPSTSDTSRDQTLGSLRYDPLIEKLVQHVRSSTVVRANSLVLKKGRLDTSTWILRLFCSMLDASPDQTEARARLLRLDVGISTLAIDMIAPGMHPKIVLQSIKLVISLLKAERMKIQDQIHSHLQQKLVCSRFMTQLQTQLNSFRDKVEKNEHFDDSAISMVQLLCKGHHSELQNLLRSQPDCNINIIEDLVHYAQPLFAQLNRRDFTVLDKAVKMLDAIKETIQGPCHDNQLVFAQYGFLNECNRVLRVALEEIRTHRLGTAPTPSKTKMLSSAIPMTGRTASVTIVDAGKKPIPPVYKTRRNSSLLRLSLNQQMNESVPKQVVMDAAAIASSSARQTKVQRLVRSVLTILYCLLERRGNGTISYLVGETKMFDTILQAVHFDLLRPLIFTFADKVASLESLSPKSNFYLNDARCKALCLILQLRDLYPEAPQLKEFDSTMSDNSEVAKAVTRHIDHVEVVWDGLLQKVYFPVPELYSLWEDGSEKSKAELLDQIKRTNQEAKLQDFIVRAQQLRLEMIHRRRLHSIVLGGIPLDRIISQVVHRRLTTASFYLTSIINLILLFGYAVEQDVPTLTVPRETILALGSTQLLFSAAAVLIFAIVNLPLEHMKSAAKTKLSTDNSTKRSGSSITSASVKRTRRAWKYLQNLVGLAAGWAWQRMHIDLIKQLIFLGISIYALTFQHWCYCFLLLEIINRDKDMLAVVDACYHPRKSLCMTLLLGLFLMYIFSSVAFFTLSDGEEGFRQELGCETVWGCMLFIVNFGLRASGGIGDKLQDGASGTGHDMDFQFQAFAFVFYVVFCVVLLNIIFGIIIDSFGERRAFMERTEQDKKGRCFICGIDRHTFDHFSNDRVSGFMQHCRHDHSIWSFLKFMIHIWEQDDKEDNGLEGYVRTKIQKRETLWFPVARALCLETKQQKDKDGTKELMKQMWHDVENRLALKMEEVEQRLVIKMEQQVTNNQALSSQSPSLADEKRVSYKESLVTAVDVPLSATNRPSLVLTPDAPGPPTGQAPLPPITTGVVVRDHSKLV